MELYLEQQQLSCFSLAVQRAAEERFSADAVIPDTLPDAAALLLTEGELCLWRLDLEDGSAELEGDICARICYRSETGQTAGFPVSVPVSVRFRSESLSRSLRPYLFCRITDLTGQLLNSRKVRVQARLCCELQGYAASELALTTGVGAGEDGLFQRTEPQQVRFVSSVEEQVFTVADTAALHLGDPLDGRLLSHSAVPVLDETQIYDGRLILQGRVVTTLLYQDVSSAMVVSETVETPFSQLVELSAQTAVSAAETALHLTSEELRCRMDERAVEAEFHIVAHIVCTSQTEAACVTDAYSTHGDLALSWTEFVLPAFSAREPERVTADGVLLCDPAGSALITAHAALRGERVEVTALLAVASGGVQAVTGLISLDAPQARVLRLEPPVLAACAEGFSVRLTAFVQHASEGEYNLRQIASAELTPLEGEDLRPGVVLVRRSESDLWSLAKAFASSEAAIRAANPETDPPSRWLLIPKVV